MTPTDDQIDALCTRLQQVGSAVTRDAAGKSLAFVTSGVLDGSFASDTLLVAWEGQGAFFWNVGDKTNTFQLIDAGFSLRVAPTLADILNRVGTWLAARVRDERGTRLPLLEAPQGHSDAP